MAPSSLISKVSKTNYVLADRTICDSKISRSQYHDEDLGSCYRRMPNRTGRMTKNSATSWNRSRLHTVYESEQDAAHAYITEMAKMVGDEKITIDEALSAITSIRFNLLEFEEFKTSLGERLSAATFSFEKRLSKKRQQLAEQELRAHVLTVDEYLRSA